MARGPALNKKEKVNGVPGSISLCFLRQMTCDQPHYTFPVMTRLYPPCIGQINPWFITPVWFLSFHFILVAIVIGVAISYLFLLSQTEKIDKIIILLRNDLRENTNVTWNLFHLIRENEWFRIEVLVLK